MLVETFEPANKDASVSPHNLAQEHITVPEETIEPPGLSVGVIVVGAPVVGATVGHWTMSAPVGATVLFSVGAPVGASVDRQDPIVA